MNEKNNLPPLEGVKVLDLGTMISAPYSATFLADYGAEVIKVEHPQKGDTLRSFGENKNGKGVYWKTMSRNKKCITLNIQCKEGRELLLKIIKDFDILIDNFRPGTMERWGYSWDIFKSINPGLIWLRCSGYGQEGPYSSRGGFGTVAEAMSGFVSMNGYPDTSPTLPPNALADGICGILGALACVVALFERDHRSGQGQVIDIALYEALMRLMEVQLIEYDVLGKLPERLGNRSSSAAPRNIYQTKEKKWVALSASTQPIAEKVFKAINRAELIDDPRFCNNSRRMKNVEALDVIIGSWIKSNTFETVIEKFSEAGAVVGAVYTVDQIYDDEHINCRDSFIEIEDKDFGVIRLQNVIPKFSRTPGIVRFTGRDKGDDNKDFYSEVLGLSNEKIELLSNNGII